MYLAGIKDLHSREIVGFSLAKRMDTGLVLDALMKAVRFHRPPVGLILHSDRGSQYCTAQLTGKTPHLRPFLRHEQKRRL